MNLWEETGEHEMRNESADRRFVRPVELSSEEKSALSNPYVIPTDEPDIFQALVLYDEYALLGLWVEHRHPDRRFLVSQTKDIADEPYYAIGLREFQPPDRPGKLWEPWSSVIRNMHQWYRRADGRSCTHPEFLKGV